MSWTSAVGFTKYIGGFAIGMHFAFSMHKSKFTLDIHRCFSMDNNIILSGMGRTISQLTSFDY